MKLARLILFAPLLTFAASASAQSPAWEPKLTAANELTPAEAAKITAGPQQSAHDRLFQLFKDSDEASLKRNPLQALFRGDYRYADRLGDLFSDAHYRGEKAAAEHDLAALHAIPRGALGPTDQLAYDVFDYQTKDTLRGLQPDLLTLTEALPMNHFFGLHTQ